MLGVVIMLRSNNLLLTNINLSIIQNILLASTAYTLVTSIAEFLDLKFVYEQQLRNLQNYSIQYIRCELDLYHAIQSCQRVKYTFWNRISSFLKSISVPLVVVIICLVPIKDSVFLTGLSIAAFGSAIYVSAYRNKLEIVEDKLKEIVTRTYYKQQLERNNPS